MGGTAPLRRRIIWEDAVEEHDWDIKSPFDHLRRRNRQGQIIPNRKKNIPRVYRVAEWDALRAEFDPWYRPVCELRIRTGVHAKGLGALRTEHISGDRLHVPGTKSEYRDREIPITSTLRPWLDILTERATADRLITSHEGVGYNKTIHNRFRGRYWLPAHDQAGIAYRNPYVTRHTFIAWGLRIGTHPDRMVELAGHGSRQMIYERYGMNQKGLGGRRDTDPRTTGRGLHIKKAPCSTRVHVPESRFGGHFNGHWPEPGGDMKLTPCQG